MQSFHYGLLVVWIIALIGLILILVAINTDHWIIYDIVEAADIRLRYRQHPYAYDRSMGLFRECFIGDYQPSFRFSLEQMIFGKRCLNTIGRWLYPREEIADVTKIRVHSQVVWAQLITGGFGMLALLAALTISFTAWCLTFPSCLLLATGATLFAAFVLLCTAMGLWHTADYIRKDSIRLDGYYSNWPEIVRDNTDIHYDWSYMIMWAGITCALLSMFLQLICYCMVKSDSEDKRNLRFIERQERVTKRRERRAAQAQGVQGSDGGYPSPADAAQCYKNDLDNNGGQKARKHKHSSANDNLPHCSYYMYARNNGYENATGNDPSETGNGYMAPNSPGNAGTNGGSSGGSGYTAQYNYTNYGYCGDDRSTLMGGITARPPKAKSKHKRKHKKPPELTVHGSSGSSGPKPATAIINNNVR